MWVYKIINELDPPIFKINESENVLGGCSIIKN